MTEINERIRVVEKEIESRQTLINSLKATQVVGEEYRAMLENMVKKIPYTSLHVGLALEKDEPYFKIVFDYPQPSDEEKKEMERYADMLRKILSPRIGSIPIKIIVHPREIGSGAQ